MCALFRTSRVTNTVGSSRNVASQLLVNRRHKPNDSKEYGVIKCFMTEADSWAGTVQIVLCIKTVAYYDTGTKSFYRET